MTVLEAVSAHLPEHAIAISSLGPALGLENNQLRVFGRFYGLREVRWDPAANLADLLLAAAGKLEGLAGLEDQVSYLIHARTLQAVAPYPLNPLHQVKRELGLVKAEAFAITQHACASGLLAVELAGRLLARHADPGAMALILTGEKAFTRTARLIPATTVMGEGTAAILVRSAGHHDEVLSYAWRTYGRFNAGLALPPDLRQQFQLEYANALADVITSAVAKAGLTIADLDLVLPHNVNRVSWVNLCKRTGIALDRVFLDNVPRTGHCFCADAFVNLASALEAGLLRPGAVYLMAAVGLGSTFSAMVLRH